VAADSPPPPARASGTSSRLPEQLQLHLQRRRGRLPPPTVACLRPRHLESAPLPGTLGRTRARARTAYQQQHHSRLWAIDIALTMAPRTPTLRHRQHTSVPAASTSPATTDTSNTRQLEVPAITSSAFRLRMLGLGSPGRQAPPASAPGCARPWRRCRTSATRISWLLHKRGAPARNARRPRASQLWLAASSPQHRTLDGYRDNTILRAPTRQIGSNLGSCTWTKI